MNAAYRILREPVIAVGLTLASAAVIGVIFLFVSYLPSKEPLGGSTGEEFKVPEQLPEVRLLLAKYPSSVAKGFSRFEDQKIIQFHYSVAKSVDKNGDGYRETPRHLDLVLKYDESEGTIDKNPNAKLIGMQVRCTQPLSSDVGTYVDVFPPAQDGQIMDFIQHSKCIF